MQEGPSAVESKEKKTRSIELRCVQIVQKANHFLTNWHSDLYSHSVCGHCIFSVAVEKWLLLTHAIIKSPNKHNKACFQIAPSWALFYSVMAVC